MSNIKMFFNRIASALFLTFSGLCFADGNNPCLQHVTIGQQGNVATAQPETVTVPRVCKQFTIVWGGTSSAAHWFVEFKAGSPCSTVGLPVSACTIPDTSKMASEYVYRVYAGAASSHDPLIDHESGLARRKHKGKKKRVQHGEAPKIPFCLDFKGDKPAYCSGTNPPQSPAALTPLTVPETSVVFFDGLRSGSELTFGESSPCASGETVPASNPFCRVNPGAATACHAGATSCTYDYQVNGTGEKFQITVNKP